MNTRNVNPEKWVWDPRICHSSWVRETDVDDQHRDEREENIKAKLAEPNPGVSRPDLTVAVAVPVEDMLLQRRLYVKLASHRQGASA